MRVIIIDNGSKHIRSLKKLLKSHEPIVIKSENLEVRGIKSDDMVVISGGHKVPVAWHNREYAKQIQILNDHRGPIVGICLGFELITHVFGSHLHMLAKRESKKVTLQSISDSRPHGGVKNVKVYESHIWSVQQVARPLVALARSKDGIEIIRHVDRPIYGFQFHPGVSGKRGKAIFNAVFASLVGKSSP